MLTAFSIDTQILHRCRQEKEFSKDYEKDMKNPIKRQKIRRTYGQLKKSDFVENI